MDKIDYNQIVADATRRGLPIDAILKSIESSLKAEQTTKAVDEWTYNALAGIQGGNIPSRKDLANYCVAILAKGKNITDVEQLKSTAETVDDYLDGVEIMLTGDERAIEKKFEDMVSEFFSDIMSGVKQEKKARQEKNKTSEDILKDWIDSL